MAVVLSYPQMRPERELSAGMFMGDADGLVDRLIACCVIKPSTTYTGFGRELIPFDFEQMENVAEGTCQKGTQPRTSVQHKTVSTVKPQAKRTVGGKGESRVSPQHKQRGREAGKLNNPGASLISDAVSGFDKVTFGQSETTFSDAVDIVIGLTARASAKRGAKMDPAPAGVSLPSRSVTVPGTSTSSHFDSVPCAGPAFSNSPKPEGLPKPTVTLLQRAAVPKRMQEDASIQMA